MSMNSDDENFEDSPEEELSDEESIEEYQYLAEILKKEI